MVIKEIVFARSRRLENSGDVRVEARADVAQGEDPTEALRSLRAWVDERIGHRSPNAPESPATASPQGAATTRAPVAPQRPPKAPIQPPAAPTPTTPPAASQTPPNGPASRGPFSSAPRSPKALFAWCKEQEERSKLGIVKYLNGWTLGTAQWLSPESTQERPVAVRMTDFTDDQVQAAFAEVCRVLEGKGIRPSYAPTPEQREAIFRKVGLMTSASGDVVPYVPSADEVRQGLIDAVTALAQLETGADEPTDAQWVEAMSSIDLAVQAECGEAIYDINTCDDLALMGKYLRKAKDALAVGV